MLQIKQLALTEHSIFADEQKQVRGGMSGAQVYQLQRLFPPEEALWTGYANEVLDIEANEGTIAFTLDDGSLAGYGRY